MQDVSAGNRCRPAVEHYKSHVELGCSSQLHCHSLSGQHTLDGSTQLGSCTCDGGICLTAALTASRLPPASKGLAQLPACSHDGATYNLRGEAHLPWQQYIQQVACGAEAAAQGVPWLAAAHVHLVSLLVHLQPGSRAIWGSASMTDRRLCNGRQTVLLSQAGLPGASLATTSKGNASRRTVCGFLCVCLLAAPRLFPPTQQCAQPNRFALRSAVTLQSPHTSVPCTAISQGEAGR